MPEYKDFDAAWAEQTKEGPECQVMGERFQLPAEIPAMIMLELARSGKDESAQVKAEGMMRMAHSLFTEERTTSWFMKGMSLSRLQSVITWAAGQYRAMREEDAKTGEQGNVSAP